MTRTNFSLLTLAASLTLVSPAFAQTTAATDGGHETHGGDPGQGLPIQIWNRTADLLDRFHAEFPEIDLDRVAAVLESGHLPRLVSRRLRCDGLSNALACYDSGQQLVLINSRRMAEFRQSELTHTLVHEFFRMLGVAGQTLDDRYELTERLFSLIPLSQFFDDGYNMCSRFRTVCRFVISDIHSASRDLRIRIAHGQSVQARLSGSSTVTCVYRRAWPNTRRGHYEMPGDLAGRSPIFSIGAREFRFPSNGEIRFTWDGTDQNASFSFWEGECPAETDLRMEVTIHNP